MFILIIKYWPGCYIREISLEVEAPYPRCYYRFIRTVMEKISLLSSLSTKLGGLAEGDEFYIKAGLKGK